MLKTVAEVLAETKTPLARKALEYAIIFKRTVEEAKTRGSAGPDWGQLADLVAVDEFERVGVNKEVMRWPEYCDFNSQFAMSMGWVGYCRGVIETDNRVVLELEEHCSRADRTDVANTCIVHEFNSAGKLNRLRIYYQHAP